MELGPSLEQNLKYSENAQDRSSAFASVPFSISGPAMTYISLVRDKFKRANSKLVERLGEANWQRHKSIRDKMENTESTLKDVACSVFRPYSEFHDSGIGTSVPTQTEYAPSHTSFQSSNTEGEEVSLRVPKEPPEVGTDKTFSCFLCRSTISNVRNRVDWK